MGVVQKVKAAERRKELGAGHDEGGGRRLPNRAAFRWVRGPAGWTQARLVPEDLEDEGFALEDDHDAAATPAPQRAIWRPATEQEEADLEGNGGQGVVAEAGEGMVGRG